MIQWQEAFGLRYDLGPIRLPLIVLFVRPPHSFHEYVYVTLSNFPLEVLKKLGSITNSGRKQPPGVT